MYLLNLSISGLLFSLTMPIWILQIISGQVWKLIRSPEAIRRSRISYHMVHIYRCFNKITIKYWSLGSFFCRSGSFIALLNLNSSTLFLVMMAIDRFLALTRPMQSYHFRTRKMVKAPKSLNFSYLSKGFEVPVRTFPDSGVQSLDCGFRRNWPTEVTLWFKAFLCCLLCWALSFATSSVAVPYRELGSYDYFVSKNGNG